MDIVYGKLREQPAGKGLRCSDIFLENWEYLNQQYACIDGESALDVNTRKKWQIWVSGKNPLSSECPTCFFSRLAIVRVTGMMLSDWLPPARTRLRAERLP